MSAVTDQFNCERIQMLQLSLQADLAALYAAGGIVHFDEDDQTSATTIDRIVVQAMPRTVFAFGKNQATPLIFSCMVKISVEMSTNDPTTLDTYLAAIHAANTGATPAAVTTLATSLFGSRGFDWYDTNEGERSAADNTRTASITFEARFGA